MTNCSMYTGTALWRERLTVCTCMIHSARPLSVDHVASPLPRGFSWDTLPVHWFSANASSQLSAEAAARIASRHSLVIFNGQSHAYQAAPFGKNSEGKMIAGGEMIRTAADKLAIPRPSVVAYFNSVVGWTAYNFETWWVPPASHRLFLGALLTKASRTLCGQDDRKQDTDAARRGWQAACLPQRW